SAACRKSSRRACSSWASGSTFRVSRFELEALTLSLRGHTTGGRGNPPAGFLIAPANCGFLILTHRTGERRTGMKSRCTPLVFVIVLELSLAAPAAAQELRGRITGVVTDN